MKKLGGIAAVSLAVVSCAPGEPVGKFDAMKPSSLDVDFAAGEKIRFRVDAEGEVGPPYATQTRRQAIEVLQRSQLAVTVKTPSGSSSAVRCPLRGNGTMEGMSGAKLFTQGLQVACEVPVTESGKHQVSAAIEWDPAMVKPLSASVEVRRVKK